MISTGLFANCEYLQSIILPASATTVTRNAFMGCAALESLTIPAEVSDLLPSENCDALKEILVSAGNTHYSSYTGVLYNADATEILWVPMGRVEQVIIPQSITAIGEDAFKNTRFTAITLPEALTSIGRSAFSKSALVSISIPESITNIPQSMVQNSTSLTTVTLGAGTEYVGNYAFSGCPLQDFYIYAAYPPVVAENAFYQTDITNCVLHVPAGSRGLYRNHSKWKNFKRVVEI